MQRRWYHIRQRSGRRYLYTVGLPIVLAVSIFSFQCVLGRDAYGEVLSCKNADVVVYSQNRRDAEIACEGANHAIQFLNSLGVDAKAAMKLRVVNNFSAAVNNKSIAGYFSPKDQCAYVLSFAEVEKRGTPFDMPVDATLYRSIITHEVAHLIAAENFAVPKPLIKAKEYLAYVTMFATMPAVYRRQLFEKFPAKAFESELDINTMIYLFDPTRFGVSAYQHFLGLKNRRSFIRRILTGQALSTNTLY